MIDGHRGTRVAGVHCGRAYEYHFGAWALPLVGLPFEPGFYSHADREWDASRANGSVTISDGQCGGTANLTCPASKA